MSTLSNQGNQTFQSMLQLLGQQIASGTDISPYLSAIQSLNGQTPGEKYKDLNLLVKKIITNKKNVNQKPTSIDASPQIPSAILPLVQILVGNELKSIEAVLEALKSEDKTVVNKALLAKWFFDASNANVDANYFFSNLMPHVSTRTRFRIIKILSQSLIGAPKKAEDFFKAFVEKYGLDEALPLLPACGDDFIFDRILKLKIQLSNKMLLVLYERHPQVAIRYLNLGNMKNESNKEERQLHSVRLSTYLNFLPHLIRHHVRDFIELYDPSYRLKLGSTVSALFLKNAAYEVIRKPHVYLNIISLKFISKKLTTQQFEEMYANLFPEIVTGCDFGDMLRYLKYYPQEKRLDLMTRIYKTKYSRELLSCIQNIDSVDLDLVYNLISPEFFEVLYTKSFPLTADRFDVDRMIEYLHKYPREKRLNLLMDKFHSFYNENLLDNINRIKSESLLKLLPSNERKNQAKRLIELYEADLSGPYYKWCCYLPPNQCFPIFKEVIAKSSSDTIRYEYIEKMLKSCAIYKSNGGLLNVLRYYNTRHKNERLEVLSLMLLYVSENFNLNIFDRSHWQILLEIMQRAHTKNELFKLSNNQIGPFFGAAVYHLMIQCKRDDEEMMPEDDKIFLNQIFSMTVDYNVESSDHKWIFLLKFPTIQRYCLDKLLNLIATKYPKEHSLWQSKKGPEVKVKVTIDILNALEHCNEEIDKYNKESKNIKSDLKKLKLLDYSWVVEATKELFNSTNVPNYKLNMIKTLVKKHDLQFYDSLMSQEYSISNIRSGAAWVKLKKDQDDVLTHWIEYLAECREILKFNSKSGGAAARRFLLSTKWYKDLPLKFIDRCLLEIKEAGSIKVLGILLEGDVFGKLVIPFVPQKSSVDAFGVDARDYYTFVQSILPAMNLTNPPMSFEVITQFCQGDYIRLAIQAFTNASQRLSATKVIAFAKNLVDKPISVKTHGYKLLFQVTSRDELRETVRETWCIVSHVTIRELIASLVQERLIKKSNEDSWALVRICIDGLTIDDEVPLNVLCRVNLVNNEYLTRYITLLLSKIEELRENGLDPNKGVNFVCMVLENISFNVISFLSEDTILELLENYFFDTNSSQIHTAANTFAKKVFSRAFDPHLY